MPLFPIAVLLLEVVFSQLCIFFLVEWAPRRTKG